MLWYRDATLLHRNAPSEKLSCDKVLPHLDPTQGRMYSLPFAGIRWEFSVLSQCDGVLEPRIKGFDFELEK